jgi:DNA-directed RNA polymerase subunit RPC12/RpoP
MKKEIEKENVKAVCPYCKKKIDLIWVCKIESVIGTRYVFFCSECQKSLGISHEKKFVSGIANDSIKNAVSRINNPF